MGVLAIISDLKKTEMKETDTHREKKTKDQLAGKKSSKKRQASGGTSESSEIRKLIEVNNKNKMKIERLLNRMKRKAGSPQLEKIIV